MGGGATGPSFAGGGGGGGLVSAAEVSASAGGFLLFFAFGGGGGGGEYPSGAWHAPLVLGGRQPRVLATSRNGSTASPFWAGTCS